ncbi:hypothetical protein PGB90_003627 [Kerria lacca]
MLIQSRQSNASSHYTSAKIEKYEDALNENSSLIIDPGSQLILSRNENELLSVLENENIENISLRIVNERIARAMDDEKNENRTNYIRTNISTGIRKIFNDSSTKKEQQNSTDGTPVVSVTNHKDEKYENIKELSVKATATLAVGIISSLLLTSSIYGLISFISNEIELLVPAMVIVPFAGLLCFILVFYDTGIFDVSEMFGGLFYFFVFVGAIVKIAIGCLLFYFVIIVYSYYWEVREGGN